MSFVYLFLKCFATGLYDIKYSISNLNNLKTDLFDPLMGPSQGQSGPGSNGNEGLISYYPDLQNRILTVRCSIILRTRFYGVLYVGGGI